ncbi:MAG: AAA family ATPase, partial [Actinomycetota bacterium]|nr:AAA family ATPase [Actinomycetota bacterium]
MTAGAPFCPACGAENRVGARFCGSCGAALATPARPPAEARKIVTVLFSDMAGFTGLGEELDPEALRQLMARYFERMDAVVKRHGGRTEKFIGDAVMAVFGVPRSHEDDAHRALRAALEMREALRALNVEFEQTWGVQVVIRTGVNTGEVVAGGAGEGQSLVAGDAVNVASRLEEAAQPGEILVGEATYRLVKESVTAELLPPLALKGKAGPVTAWRLVHIAAEGPRWGRRLDSPVIGRDDELGRLREAFDEAVASRECRVITVMGPAGVGKSRLTGELLAALGTRAAVVGGRCLPYGEGITFWPVVEIVRDAAGIAELDSADEASVKIAELLSPNPDAHVIAERLAGLVGLVDFTPGIQESFWAVRKLLETLASRAPLIAAFDDVHWAEPTFLDLLEYLADTVRNVPMLVVCLARPELLELRGTWMTGKPNAALLPLSPLTESDTDGLIQSLLKGGPLADDIRERIAGAAEGNPLFVEETLRMLVDDGVLQPVDGSWSVSGDVSSLSIPPTIHALLTARLDRLEDDERAVIRRASVIGRVFWWGAVAAMSPEDERQRVGALLQSLARKELIGPDRSDFLDEDAFRFAHILVADAAYRGIPKLARADLHERFAAWIETKTHGRAAEYDEFLGYHLEQAYRSLRELGHADERTRSLAGRASAPLASAGRRAFARGDMPAAVNLLSRAVALQPQDEPARLELLPDLAFALLETGDFARLQDVVSEASEAATECGDRRLQAHVLTLRLLVQLFTDPEGWGAEAQQGATDAIAIFDELGDERGLAKAWSLLGLFHLLMCEFAASEDAWEKSAAHADAAGEEREKLESLSWVPLCVWGGPTPVEEGIRRCQTVLARANGDRKAMSTALFTQAKFEAMRGNFAEARDLIARAKAMLEEVALTVWIAGPLTQMTAWVELLAGDSDAAERELRWGVDTLREIGEFAWLPTVAGILAEAVYVQGRDEEAEDIVTMGEETAGSDDAYSQGLLRSVRAKSLARRGQFEDAERL